MGLRSIKFYNVCIAPTSLIIFVKNKNHIFYWLINFLFFYIIIIIIININFIRFRHKIYYLVLSYQLCQFNILLTVLIYFSKKKI